MITQGLYASDLQKGICPRKRLACSHTTRTGARERRLMSVAQVSAGARDSEALSKGKLAAYSLPSIPIAAVGLPMLVHIPPYYASQMGLSLELVGLLFMLARLWDVFTDPVLGILSDKFETRWGRRRHWIVLSVPIMIISVVMLFMPAGPVSGFYLLFWLFALYAGWTLLTISHSSWGAELSGDYHERNKVQGAKEIATVVGLITVLMLPVFIDFFVEEGREAKRIAAMGWFMIILLPVTVWIAVSRVGERPTPPPEHISYRKALGAMLKNQPLRIVLTADIIGGISFGMHTGTFLFLVTHVLLLPAMSGIFLLCYVISGILFIPVALRLAGRWDKHLAASALMLLSSCLMVPIIFLPAGKPVLGLICFALWGLTSASGSFLFRSMIADVADQDAVDTGQQRTGLYFAVVSMTSKVGGAMAIWISYSILAWIGFDPNGVNSPETLLGLRLTYSLPAVSAGIIGALLFRRYKLTQEVQVRNRDILDQRVIDAIGVGVEGLIAEPQHPQASRDPAGDS